MGLSNARNSVINSNELLLGEMKGRAWLRTMQIQARSLEFSHVSVAALKQRKLLQLRKLEPFPRQHQSQPQNLPPRKPR